MLIEIVNTIESRTDDNGAKHLTHILSYPSPYWRKSQWGMKRYEDTKVVIKKSKNDGYHYFLTGFIPRIKKQYPTAVVKTMFNHPNEKFSEPTLKGIQFRPDQKRLMAQALAARRGVIQSATGTGKTLLQLGIISAMPKGYSCLVLAHTKDIVNQTYEELKKFGFGNKTQIVWEGQRPTFAQPIIVATIQSFSGYSVDDYMTHFDIVMVDEGHRVSSFTGVYHQVLSTLLTPYRFAFTATLPQKKEAEMVLEGLIGPVVAKLTINQAAELQIIAKPKLKLIKLPENHMVRQTCRSYDEVVKHGIVGSASRTEKIVNLVRNGIKQGKVTLVVCNQIEHGRTIQAQLEEKGVKIPFVHGATNSLDRIKIKNALIDKKLLAAICTVVWREGVNIQSIDTIILAHLGKSDLVTLQTIGRGLRRTGEKDKVTVVDFFDPSHIILVRHFGERLCLYFDFGWV